MKVEEPTLVRAFGTALHRQIYLVLRDRILQGVYEPGTTLPTEESLTREFAVARVTVRRAVEDLQKDGMVQKRQGSGTFVREDVSVLAPMPMTGLVDELLRTAHTTEVEVLKVERRTPPAMIAAALQLPPDTRGVYAQRLRSADGMPLMLQDTWVPETLGRNITASELKRRSLYEILAREGIRLGRVIQQVSADAADPARARLLACEVGSPLIRLTRLFHDRKGRPVRYLRTHMNPAYSSIVMDIPREDVENNSGGRIVHETQTRGKSAESPQRPRAATARQAKSGLKQRAKHST